MRGPQLMRLVQVVACILLLSPPSVQQTYTNPSTPPHVFINEDEQLGYALTNITDNDPNGPGRIASIDYLGSDWAFYTVKIPSEPKWKVFLNRTLDYDRGERTLAVSFVANGASANVYASPFRIMLHVDDVNDNVPEFQNLPYNVEVNEDTALGTVVYTAVRAVDIDTGLGGIVDYQLVGNPGADHGGKFSIDSRTGDVTLNGTVDYETTSFYRYFVLAKDRGNPALTSTANLFITVNDAQDLPPVFTNVPFVRSVDENVTLGTSVLQVKAVDQDRGIPNEVVYNITQSTCAGYFEIDSRTGVLFVARPLDRDNSTIHSNNGVCTITVQAAEETARYPQRGNSTAVAKATIIVNDVNDNAPAFTSGKVFSASVVENSPPGTWLQVENDQLITVQDIDQGPNSLVRLSLLTGGDTLELVTSSIQSSGPIQLRVKNSAALDYEAMQFFTVLIEATNEGAHFSPATATVTVKVIDMNDNAPTFQYRRYEVDIRENIMPGTRILSIQATDADSGRYGRIKFSLVNGLDFFSINPASGVVTAVSYIDREMRAQYYVLAAATDVGGRIDEVPIIINITDVNDNPPRFMRSRYDAVMNETLDGFTRPVTVKAEDMDAGMNSAIMYSIVSAKPSGALGHFTVDPIGGQLTVTSRLQLDVEAISQDNVRLVVTAVDQGVPSFTATTTVAVVLTPNGGCSTSRSTQPSSAIPESSTQETPKVMTPRRVAFHARHFAKYQPQDGSTRIFRDVLTNHGNAYDNATGSFTSPVNGAYFLGATRAPHANSNHASLHMVVDGVIVSEGSDSVQTVVDLVEGAKAWVMMEGDLFVSQGITFSGFLLEPDLGNAE